MFMKLLASLEGKLESLDSPVDNRVNLSLAAVLIPIFIDSNKILFTKRTENLKHHQGQIAFPGGRYEDSDVNLVNTVLRETEEEIGIEQNKINLIGRLEPLISTSRHNVYPFIGFIHNNPIIKINPHEVQEYFFADLSHLLKPSTLKINFYKGAVRKYYKVNRYKIWGLTQQILSNFLSLIKN